MTIFSNPNMKLYYLSVILGMVFLFSSCNSESINKQFRFVPSDDSGLTFSNDISSNDSFNILNFHYIYNGGGVGVGDFDKNGLPDLVFSGNQVSSKLYLNQGNLTFQDISEVAKISTKRWATGVSIADINADGWEDIYVSVGGLDCQGDCLNYLFVHQGLNEAGIPIFEEKAKAYGLEDGLYTQQAAFFDFDNDGDLDVYLLRNAINLRDKNTPYPKRFISENSQDALFENLGQVKGQIVFKDVSATQNITHRGYGLGITINDFNLDGRSDIYVANDFLSEDLLYLNRGKSGFKEVSKEYLKHTSYNAMGVDVADINNDGLPEIMVLDMLPETQERRKSMQGFMNYNKFSLTLQRGYMPQFIRNTLQLHNGFLDGKLLPFSDVGYLAGVYNTDWSWAPLLADFDNDGDRDIYVTNGYGKDITDLDFINYSNSIGQFGTKEALQQKLVTAIDQMKNVEIPNYFFENEGNLNFKNQSTNWTTPNNSISNGAIYADLDNDGDLDIVTNNINQTAFVLENQTTGNNYLKIKLKGPTDNPQAIGAFLDIRANGKYQRYFHSPVRGYLSSVDPIVHIGLGDAEIVEELSIYWSMDDNVGTAEISIINNISVNQTIIIDYEGEEMEKVENVPSINRKKIFHPISLKGLEIEHQENYYQDYDFQPLLLKQFSKQGPCLTVANVDGKKGDELFIGGAKGFAGHIYTQQEDGSYQSQALPDSLSEDTDAIFLDIDKDGDLDLYVVSGGSEFLPSDAKLTDRVYLNDGQGYFAKSGQYKSPVKSSGSIITTTKPNEEGNSFIFIGGRIIPGKYPTIPTSSILTNHLGKLVQQREKFANGLSQIGLVTDALFTDYNKDNQEDLIILTEWGKLAFYKNRNGLFDRQLAEINIEENSKLQAIQPTGFWSAIAAGDFDKDGDMDYMLGNLGENTNLKATTDEPLFLYIGDYDKNGGMDPLVGHFYMTKKGERKNFPLHARDDVVRQLVKVKSRFRSYAEFGSATLNEILTDIPEKDFLQVNYLKSSYLENKGNGQFVLHPLPKAAQLAPIQDFLIDDFDKDGNLDALLVGNDYNTESSGGQQDASNGLLLKGDGKGSFHAIETGTSGFFVPKDGRDIVKMTDRDGKEFIVVGQNSSDLKIFSY